MQSSAGAAAGGLDGSSDSAPAAAAPSAARAAAAAADTRSSQCVLLVLSAEDYGAALEGRLTSLLEEKVSGRSPTDCLAGRCGMQGSAHAVTPTLQAAAAAWHANPPHVCHVCMSCVRLTAGHIPGATPINEGPQHALPAHTGTLLPPSNTNRVDVKHQHSHNKKCCHRGNGGPPLPVLGALASTYTHVSKQYYNKSLTRSILLLPCCRLA